jgi:hypothetical protein
VNADGTECYQASADASTFNNTPAVAVKKCVPNGTFGTSTLQNNSTVDGSFTGPGTLTAYAAYSLNPGEFFFLPETVEAAIPEPSSLALIAAGLLAIALLARKPAT